MKLRKIKYDTLNVRQKEAYNYQKVSAILADYGYTTIKLDDDWKPADFIALYKNGKHYSVRLKTMLTFNKKYINKDVYVCFRDGEKWYLYPHNKLLQGFKKRYIKMFVSDAWVYRGICKFPKLTKAHSLLLKNYKIN